MVSESPRYRDYLDSSDSDAAIGVQESGSTYRESYPQVLVNQNRFDGTWSAIHETNEGVAGELDSVDRAEAVAWAHARCAKVLVFDPETGEFTVAVQAE